MYNNQPPQTAYQQSYNNTSTVPAYPQNSQQATGRQAMVEKYPLQIWVAARAGMSLTCAADLKSPEEWDTKNSPMEMHSGFSVFRMAIASSEKGSVVANIPASDVPYLLNQYHFQRNILNRQAMSIPNTPAYTVPIKERNCKNRTAAEVLQMENGLNILTNARKFFAANLNRYPKNEQMVKAIDEALFLYQSRQLSQSVNLPPLYSSPVKPKSNADKNNRHTAYSISISGSSSSTVDWTFEIFNCKALLRNMGKLKVVDVEHAEEKKTLTFKITQQEMDLFIYRLQSTLENFERMNFQGQYKIARRHVKYSREVPA